MDCKEILCKYYYQLLELWYEYWEPCHNSCSRCCSKKLE